MVLAHARSGGGVPVVCLHGWPGASSDYRALLPLVERDADVVVPDLLGFGASFTPADAERPPSAFGRDAQVAAVLDLMDHLALGPAVLVGYDVGSTVAIALARAAPGRVRGLVLGNPVHPGGARKALEAEHRAEFWYQDFHRLALCADLVDGSETAVRRYLEHFWGHWGHRAVAEVTDDLVAAYARPGAFTASLNWYRSGSATIAAARNPPAEPPPPVEVPARVLWGVNDPIFPIAFAEGLGETLADHELETLDVGHFVPLEAAVETAHAVRSLL